MSAISGWILKTRQRNWNVLGLT